MLRDRDGRQPMIMVRGSNGKVNVLYNRCPHDVEKILARKAKGGAVPLAYLLAPEPSG